MSGTSNKQATLPQHLVEATLDRMTPGEVAYTLPWGMWADSDYKLWLHPHYPADSASNGTASMRVERRSDGYHVWPPSGETYSPRSEPGYHSPADTAYIPVAEIH